MNMPVSLNAEAHILIVLTGALGDVARGIVVPTLLKNLRPDVKISWLVEHRWSEIVELCPSVDVVIPYYRRERWWGVPQLRKALRDAGPFDWALDLQRHLKSGVFTRMSGAPRRMGFSRRDAKEGNWLFQTDRIPNCDMKTSKVYHYQAFVDALLGESSGEISFEVNREDAQHSLVDILPEKKNRWITCVLGSSWPSKDWRVSGYEELIADLLREEDCSVFLSGDTSQHDLGERLASVHPDRVYNLAGETTLTQLVGLLSLSDIACGPDTGTGHIASLVETPYVGFFGPTDPRRVAPFGSEHLAIAPVVPCGPCGKRICPGFQNACMRKISPKEVKTLLLHPTSGVTL